MNLEQLKKGCDLANDIQLAKRHEEFLKNEDLIIGINTDNCLYGFREKDIELLPEEEEALQSIREAYRTVLLTAVNRKHQQLRKEFEQL